MNFSLHSCVIIVEWDDRQYYADIIKPRASLLHQRGYTTPLLV